MNSMENLAKIKGITLIEFYTGKKHQYAVYCTWYQGLVEFLSKINKDWIIAQLSTNYAVIEKRK